jgi:polyribonucleotide nucleotidyltransferase
MLAATDLDLVVAGTSEKTIMVEAGANIVPEAVALEAIKLALTHLNPIIDLINQVQKAVGKSKIDLDTPKTEEEAAKRAELQALHDKVTAFLSTKTGIVFTEPLKTKADRKVCVGRLKKEVDTYLTAEGIGKDMRKKADVAINDFVESEITKQILDTKRRADGRSVTEIRSLGALVAFCCNCRFYSASFLAYQNYTLNVFYSMVFRAVVTG